MSITVQGLYPPRGFGYRALLYELIGFPLSLMAVIMIGNLLPINYEHWLYVGLYDASQSNPDSLVITVDAHRRWSGPYRFKSASCWQGDYATLQAFNNADHQNEALVEPVWKSVVANYPQLLPVADRDALREEFIEVFIAACDFDEARALRGTKHFRIQWEYYKHSDYHPLYVTFGFLWIIVVMVYLVFRVRRDADNANARYINQCIELRQRYENSIEKNR